MSTPRVRVLIYTRVSLDRTGEGLAVDRQLERCRAQIAAKSYAGWVEFGHESDNSISAYTGKHRPGWARVLEHVKAGRVDVVIAWHLDRMTRSVLELEELILLCERYDVDIATIEGDIDLSRTTGRLVARILAAVARAEVEMKTARQLLKFDQLAAAGAPFTGGRRAFGYALDRMTVVEDEAEAIRWAAEEYLRGMPLAHIARRWDELGLVSSRRNDYEGTTGWTATGVRQVLENPRYAAIRMHRGERAGAAAWPAILDEDTHLAIVAKLANAARPAEKRGKGPVPQTLLSTIAVCRTCGETARGSRIHGGRAGYTCASPARHFQVPRDEADHEVASAIIAALSMPEIGARLATDGDTGRIEVARAEAAQARTRLAELGEDYASGLIDRETMVAATARLRQRIEAAEEVLGQVLVGTALDGIPVGTPEAGALWNDLDLHRQRGILQLLTREVVITRSGPGRRFRAAEQIEIRWAWDQPSGGAASEGPEGGHLTVIEGGLAI